MNSDADSTTGLSVDALGADHRPSSMQDGGEGGAHCPPAWPSTHTPTTTVGQEPAGEPAADTGRAVIPAPTSVVSDLPRRSPETGPNEAIVCMTAVLTWVIFVGVGVAVPTKPYIDLMSGLDGKTSFLGFAHAMFVILTCYTFTNIAALCCLSAVIGAIGRSARIDDSDRTDPATDLRTLCISALIRGFFLYLVILSGTLFLSEQKFDSISIEQYLKLTGLVSLLSFAIGYDPHLFGAFFQRVIQWSNNASTPSVRR